MIGLHVIGEPPELSDLLAQQPPASIEGRIAEVEALQGGLSGWRRCACCSG